MSNDTPAASTNITAATPAPAAVDAPAAPPPSIVRPKIDEGKWSPALIMLAVFAVVFAFIEGGSRSTNYDVWSSLATGRALSDGTYHFGTDPFSWGSEGTWVNHSWLFSWLLFQLHEDFGPQSLGIVKAILAVVLVGLILASKPRDGTALLAVEVASLVILVVGIRWLLQPIVVSCVFLPLTLLLLYRGGTLGGILPAHRPSEKALWAIPLVFALWANLDSWVILGPLVLLLTFLASLLPFPREDRARTTGKLGLLLLAGIVGCMVNPHHVGVFQLPPELAYLILPIGRHVLPGGMMAGGEALDLLQQTDPSLYFVWSPLNSDYLRRNAGLTISGLALYPLIILHLGSFLFSGIRSTGAAARFAISVVGALLAIATYRTVPLYAALAGPILIWNAVEFKRRRADVVREPMLHPPLARLLATVMLLAGILLAWPGFLHGDLGNFRRSTRRFDLGVYPDPSLKEAAVHVEETAKKGKPNVFNFHHDVAAYLAWFAPSAKSYQDSRLTLFRQADEKLLAINDSLKKAGDQTWRKILDDMGTNQVLLSGVRWEAAHATPDLVMTAQVLFVPGALRLTYADGLSVAFERTPGDTKRQDVVEEWNKEVFGQSANVPNAPTVIADLDPMTQYLVGYPPVTRPNAVRFLGERAQIEMQREAGEIGKKAFLTMVGHAAWMAGAISYGPYPYIGARENAIGELNRFNRTPMLPPPAVGMLMLRSARRAVADNPLDRQSFDGYRRALDFQTKAIEGEWLRLAQHQSKGLRAELRHYQIIAALRAYLELEPTDVSARIALADSYRQNRLFDAAVQEFDKAVRDASEPGNVDVQALKRIEELKKSLTVFEADLKNRKEDYELKAAKATGIQKVRLAFTTPFRTTSKQPGGREREVEEPNRGLGLEALAQLNNLKVESLSPMERDEVANLKVNLNLMLGNLLEAGAVLNTEKFGPRGNYFAALLAGAMGDYDRAENYLAEVEMQAAAQAQSLAVQLAAQRVPLGLLSEPGGPWLGRLWVVFLIRDQGSAIHLQTVQSIADVAALRGILQLESGNPKEAMAHFERAKRYVGDVHIYNDQPISDRYLPYLKKYQK